MTADHSLFAADLVVTGTVTGRGRLDVDGRVEGDVSVQHLSVNRDGTLTGNARADDALLSGSLVGTIRAQKVTVARSGRLSGLVEYEVLGIEPGGTFEAECRPTTAPALETGRRAAAAGQEPAAPGAARRLAPGPA
ncbi:polymer-forming cytoskeletal protein [Caenispirillum salinarum]|uniref:bactofilin family protein n=1 Tax=Caenispirillum salinarum TaxID=859058 RepID=UPI00384D3C15